MAVSLSLPKATALSGNKGRRRAFARATAVGILVVAWDQLSKTVARNLLLPGHNVHLLLGVSLIRVRNSGASFNLLEGHGLLVGAFTILVTAVVVAYLSWQHRQRWVWLGCGLILGGGLSNLTDRALTGAVTDFIRPLGFPIAFNFADVAVVAGALTLIYALATMPLNVRRP